jgi:hypothetical protein
MMEIKKLRERWREVLKTEPPPKMQSGFLRLAIAYRLQEQAFGGLKPDTLRKLRKHAKLIHTKSPSLESGRSPTGAVAFDAQASLSTGTRLMREWNGSTELVDVVENGFIWRGTLYKTLSATAVAITGTKWSGPKFFGLHGVAKSTAKRSAKSAAPVALPLEAQAA